MERTQLTVRVPKDWLEGAREYARQHNTTVSKLVRLYLRHLSIQTGPLKDAPITQRLSGILTQDVSAEDYREYLESKYLQSNRVD
jgi:hypothetical protein